jgi:hypothetical protein
MMAALDGVAHSVEAWPLGSEPNQEIDEAVLL